MISDMHSKTSSTDLIILMLVVNFIPNRTPLSNVDGRILANTMSAILESNSEFSSQFATDP